MNSLVARSSRTRVEILLLSHPPLFAGRSRRSVSTAQDRPALGFAALERAAAFPSCSRPVSRSICKSFPDNATQSAGSALCVIDAECNPLVISEIELSKIAFQMRLTDMMVDADDPAFQDREIAFDRVGVRIAANVFFGGMVHALVTGKVFADFHVNAAFVGTQMRLRRNPVL